MQGGGKSPKNEEDDVAYVTKSFILDLLIKALHEENVAIPLTLGNVKIIDWQLNEFISHIQLFNDEEKQISQRNFSYKFAEKQVDEKIKELNPGSVELTVHRSHWTETGKLEELCTQWDQSRYTIRYNFRTGILSKSSPKHRRKF